ncbi:MAG: hypothetical protein P8J87_09760, partial [Verrucomicrobiales bacterium]|nr:hypothetical protein [Verrucomicrobiales bacterium]
MKIFHLEMNSPDELVPATSPLRPTLQPVSPPDPAINRRFYRDVGTSWDWNDRATWTLGQWAANLAANPISTLTLHHSKSTIGYSELLLAGGDIEIVYFGLLPEFVGHGLGGT